MNRKALFTFLAVGLILVSTATGMAAKSSDSNVVHRSLAATGTTFTYQGQLKNNNALFNGTCDFQFSLHDAVTSGNQIGGIQTKNNVAVSNGLFTVNLDFGNAAFNGEGRWLDIQVRCPAGSGSYTALSPRQPLTATPYALSLVPGTIISGPVASPAIEVINTTNTGWAAAIYGEIRSNTDDSMAIYGYSKATGGWSNGVVGGSDSPNGNGVLGYVTAGSGWPNGVYGASDNAPDGNGVLGENHVTTGYGTGVLGQSNSPDGSGVAGRNNNATGDAKGVYGETSSPDGAGVYGVVITTTAGNNGRGVYGLNNATAGVGDGVFGETYSSDGAGVSGYNNSPTGKQGVWGGINSSDGAGVKGVNFATAGWANGVIGESNSPDGYGVAGVNSATTGWGIGVYGDTSSDGPAVAAYNSDTGIGLWTRSVSGNPIVAHGSSGTDVEFYVANNGDVFADGAYQSPAADFAEMLPAQAGLEPGDVLVIGSDGKLTRCTQAYQTSVVGVFSTNPGFLGGSGDNEVSTGKVPLAVVGVVPVKISAANGAIRPGDLLTTSSIPGYAMKAKPMTMNGYTSYQSGAIIGKALGTLDNDTGMIQMLVMLQ
jgi:hypothetical protein